MTELLRLPTGKLLIATLGLGGAAEESAGGREGARTGTKEWTCPKTDRTLSSTDLPLEGPAVKRAA